MISGAVLPEWVLLSEAAQLWLGEAEVPESLPSSCSLRWSCPLVPRAVPALRALRYQPWLTNGWQMRLAWVEGGAPLHIASFSPTVENADTVQPGERSPYGCDFLSSSLFFSLFLFFFPSCFYSSKGGASPPPHPHPLHPHLQHVCLSLLSSEVEGVLLSFLSECAQRVCESAMLRD